MPCEPLAPHHHTRSNNCFMVCHAVIPEGGTGIHLGGLINRQLIRKVDDPDLLPKAKQSNDITRQMDKCIESPPRLQA